MWRDRFTAVNFRHYSQISWLGLATLFLFFANGQYIIFIATWLAPFFLIRYLRSTGLILGLLSALFINTVVTIATWRGMIPVPGATILLVGTMIGVISFSPYLVDRLFYTGTAGFSKTLIFPCSWVSFEYLNSLFNPYSTWGSLAYTQFDAPLAFLQLASITGIWGLTFFITWFASILNWAWERRFAPESVTRGIGLFAGILLIVGLIGAGRLAFFTPEGPSVRVASIVSPFEWKLDQNISNAKELSSLRKTSMAVQSELLNLSKQAALADADIVLWNEAAAPVFEADEKAFVEKAGKAAENLGLYLLISLYTRPADYPDRSMQNKVFFIDSDGRVIFEYVKAKPIPGENAVPGAGKLKSAQTSFGTIASMICFDMDFPLLVSQAGRKGVDLMLVPADDWSEINPIHTHMAAFRAIENGFSLVRSTKDGLSAAFDYQGRMVAAMDESLTEKRVMFADLPIKGGRTLYPLIGDLFAWICLAGLVVILLWEKAAKRRRK